MSERPDPKKHGYLSVRELSIPREIYKDPFMQEVRDKIDLIHLARKAMEGYELIYGTMFNHMENNISKCKETSDTGFIERRESPQFSYERENGIESTLMMVDNDGKELFAGIYVKTLKGTQNTLEEK